MEDVEIESRVAPVSESRDTRASKSDCVDTERVLRGLY